MQTKKWYQSKIVLLGLTFILVFGSNAILGFISGQGVTLEQIQAVEQIRPDISDTIKKLQGGGNILDVLGILGGALIILARVWFTNKLIPQSIRGN